MKIKHQILNGVEYVYEDQSVWDKEKRYSTHKRKYIGKMVDGVFVPNQRYQLEQELEEEKKRGPKPNTKTSRLFGGATYLFDQLGEQLGIRDDLKTCFPKQWKQLLSVAYFMVLEQGNSFSRFPKWAKIHEHPYGKELNSQRISELLGSITEEQKQEFFRRQIKRRSEAEYLAYDTTSISSYSQVLKQVKYGHNKEDKNLAQINLAMVYGEESRLPVYYCKLAGNISDVKTITQLLRQLDQIGMDKVRLVMDRGFYSRANINELMKKHYSFLIGVKRSLRLSKNLIKKLGPQLLKRANYLSDEHVYALSCRESWDYTEIKARSGEIIHEQRRVYLHLYYNDLQAAQDRLKFQKLLDQLERELADGDRCPEHESLYAKYYEVKETKVRGVKVVAKEGAIAEKMSRSGYFILMSNHIKDSAEALKIYRLKDVIEKAFGNIKERLNGRTTTASSEENLEGKLFVQFIALMYLSQIQKVMNEQHLFRKYTTDEFLDELDVIECYREPKRKAVYGEMTQKQSDLYAYFNVTSPR